MDDLLAILPGFLPLPTVALDQPSVPRDGLFVSCPAYCRKAYNSGKCTRHYESLSDPSKLGQFVECPQGYTSVAFSFAGSLHCFTSFIAIPRNDSTAAKERAKYAPESKVARERVLRFLAELANAEMIVTALLQSELAARMHPLHEIRRLNATIKTIMERTCRRNAPSDPENADQDLVRAWKASEVVSHQLDALDVYSRPDAVREIPNSDCEFYKLVDKVVRIWRPTAQEDGKSVRLEGRCHLKTWVHFGTIHIIPSVLIDNAIKYSPVGAEVVVRVDETQIEERNYIRLTVQNVGPYVEEAERASLLKKRFRGRRARSSADGTGLGLLLAQKVAHQHHTRLTYTQTRIGVDDSNWMFEVLFLARQGGTSQRTRNVQR